MLPIETFSDVVSFLGYYDLGGLKHTNKLLSTVANRCADAIRQFDFSHVEFIIHDNGIHVWLYNSGGIISGMHRLKLNGAENLADFTSEAFRNCTVRSISIWARRADVLDAIKVVVKTIGITGTLEIRAGTFENKRDLFEFVDSFRRVKTLAVWPWQDLSEDEKAKLEKLCQSKNITIRL